MKFRAVFLIVALLFDTLAGTLQATPEVAVAVTRKKEGVKLFFEYGISISYGVSQGKNRIEIIFDTKTPFDKKTLKKGLPKQFSLEEVVQKSGVTSLFLKTPPLTLAKHERDEKGITVELFPGKAPPDTQYPDKDLPAPKMSTPEGNPPEVKPELITDTLEIKNSENGAELKFTFKDLPGVAAYERNGKIYLIFDKIINVKTNGSLSPEVGVMFRKDKGPLSILSFMLTNPGGFFVMRKDNQWILNLDWVEKKSRMQDLKPFEGVFTLSPENKVMYTVALDEQSTPYVMNDDMKGDTLLIVPLKNDGYAIAHNHQYIDFETISTQQGVAIAKRRENLHGKIINKHLQLNTPQGLMVSSQQDRDRERKTLKTLTLYEFKDWQHLDVPYDKFERDAQNKLAETPQGKKTAVYLELIKHALSHINAVEAIGFLRLAEEDEPRMKYDVHFHALRGAARLMIGDAQMALEDLTYNELKDEPEAKLWQGLALAKQGKTHVGVPLIEQYLPFLTLYPQPIRSYFVLKAAQAAMTENNVLLTQKLLDLIKNEKLSAMDNADYQLILGLLEKANNPEKAEEQLLKVISNPSNTKAATYADLEVILGDLESHDLTTLETIDKLEKLRYAWRGDEIEFDILGELGKLYISVGDYRKGLSTMATAVEHYPQARGFQDLSKRLHQSFSDLFLSPASDKISPLTVVSLYKAFKSLTPQGEGGDKIVLSLIDKLMTLDLPDQAISVLRDRIKLSSQANVPLIHKLAEIYVINKNWEEAQTMIDEALSQNIDESARKNLRQLKAKLYEKNKQYDDALNLLNTDDTYEGLNQKAEIYALKGHYPEAANTLGRALDTKEPSQVLAKDILNYALYLNKAQNWKGLEEVKTKYMPLLKDPQEKAAVEILLKNHDETAVLDHLSQELDEVNLYESLLNNSKTSEP